MTARAYTPEEVREQFIQKVYVLMNYWSTIPGQTKESACDGLAFSLLAMLDGSNIDFPAVDMSPAPHPDDKAYLKANGDNWYEKKVFNNCQLHDLYSAYAAKMRKLSTPETSVYLDDITNAVPASKNKTPKL